MQDLRWQTSTAWFRLSAVGVQPIPCTAALIHERVAKGLTIPAMDINTTCTSFVSALSTVSYLIEGG